MRRIHNSDTNGNIHLVSLSVVVNANNAGINLLTKNCYTEAIRVYKNALERITLLAELVAGVETKLDPPATFHVLEKPNPSVGNSSYFTADFTRRNGDQRINTYKTYPVVVTESEERSFIRDATQSMPTDHDVGGLQHVTFVLHYVTADVRSLWSAIAGDSFGGAIELSPQLGLVNNGTMTMAANFASAVDLNNFGLAYRCEALLKGSNCHSYYTKLMQAALRFFQLSYQLISLSSVGDPVSYMENRWNVLSAMVILRNLCQTYRVLNLVVEANECQETLYRLQSKNCFYFS